MSAAKSLLLIALFSALHSSVLTDTPFNLCATDIVSIIITNFNLNNCQTSSCVLIRGQRLFMSLTATFLKEVGAKNDTTVTFEIRGGPFPVSLTVPVCRKVQCPIPAGDIRQPSVNLPVPEYIPLGTYIARASVKDGGLTVLCGENEVVIADA
ncbi:uncharacterized protein LOC116178857 [Photinus pyralis]|uniref:uncharacterized protein LOC116178857 n=1 Tax=Photinus pyralis TaxID=7054 RepID=UPI00126779B7|nr:uncharacterized protein LOC116178857 [Photinus pyralis]